MLNCAWATVAPGFSRPHDHQPAAAAIGQRKRQARHVVLHHHRRPDIEGDTGERAAELLGDDSNDREVVPVQRYCSSDDVWIATKAALPQSMADDHDRVRVRRAILLGKKRSPDRCFYAEHVKVIARDNRRPHSLGLPAAPEIERHHLVGD